MHIAIKNEKPEENMNSKIEQFPAINPNPALSVAKDGTVLYSNDAGEPLLHEWGVEVGKKLPPSIADLVQRVIIRNSPEKMEIKLGKRLYLFVFHPLPEQEYVNISGFDISDQQEVEGKLRESEKKYRNIVETSVEGIWIFNSVSETTYVNEKMADMLGYNREEMIGRFIWDFAYEEDKGIFQVKLANRKQGIDEVYELKLIRKDGSPLWVSVSVKGFFDDAGKFTGSVGMFTDITERKRAEETLAFERSQLLSIFDGMDDMVYVADPYTYEVLYANKAMKEKFGGEYVGGICYRKFQRRDSPCGFCTNPIILKERDKPYSWEYYNPAVGRFFTIMDRIIKWPDGRDVRLEIAKDITEHKEAEEALRENEIFLRRLYESGVIGVIHYTLDGQIIDANEKFLEMVGYTREELMAGKINWEQMTPQEYHVLDEQARDELKATGVSKSFEKEYVRKDGSRIPIIVGVATIDDDLHKGIAFVLDNTDRKEAETKLKETLNNLDKLVKVRTAELEKAYLSLKESEERLTDAQKIAHVGSYDWNIATNEEYWSDELYRIFGLDPQFELNHNTFLKCINPEDLEYVNQAINEALNGKPYNVDYRIILPDGEERVIYSQGGIIFNEKNTPIRMRGIVQDITEYKKAEESLARIEIARKKEIHHRIKNNLQVISSLLDLQAEKFRNKQAIKDSEVLEAFRESQDRVISMALIHEELHRGEGFEKLNFSSYIEELAENLLLTYRLGNSNIKLNMDLSENILLDMDTAVPLGIIINEIVSNSLKYAFPERNAGEIQIKLHREDESNTSFVLIVSDNGVGISEDLDIEDLDSLGLQLVTSLVDQLDGALELKRNNGTEFIIRFTVTEKSNQILSPQ